MERGLPDLYVVEEIRRLELASGDQAYKTRTTASALFIVLEGGGDAYVNGSRIRLRPATVVWCGPDAFIELLPSKRGRLAGVGILFDRWAAVQGEGDERVYRKVTVGTPERIAVYLRHPNAVAALVKELEEAWTSPDDKDRLLTHGLFMKLLHFVKEDPDALAGESRSSLNEAVAYIRQNYHLPLTRDKLAKRSGFTPEYFSAAFKKATGTNFADFLTRVRLERAKREMLLSKDTLNAIARKVGYKDGLYLSRKFKQYVGVSPTVYAKRPKKIVCQQYLGHLLALGLKPAGAAGHLLAAPHLRELVAGIADVGSPVTLDRIAALEPDLIVTTREHHEHFSALAATLHLPWGQGDVFQELRFFGETLGKSGEAEAWIADFERKGELARNRLEARGIGGTAAVLEVWGDRVWAVNIGYGRGLRNLYRTLGFAPPPALAKHVTGAGPGLQLQPGDLLKFDADCLFVSVWRENGGERKLRSLVETEEWKQLAAVRRGRVHFIDIRIFAFNDPISLDKQLDIQMGLLERTSSAISYKSP